MPQKRVAAIHDISCFGKCSLTVVLPVLSACAIECSVIPTAVLSTHTGGFKGYTFRDLTEDIIPVAKHWKKEGITLDAFYTGYLGSKEQAQIVKEAMELLKGEDTVIITDPAMADHGKLYAGFTEDFPTEMLKLCKCADIILPNITEACLMTGIEYKGPPFTEEYIEMLLKKLNELTSAKIVLTGVTFDDARLGAAIYDDGDISYVFEEKIPVIYHGTGDVFAAAFTGALLNGKSIQSASAVAVRFVCDAIKKTVEENPERTYGVNFESVLYSLYKLLDID